MHVSSSKPATLASAAAAPKPPAVAGRKKRRPDFVAAPMSPAVSTPTLMAVRKRDPSTGLPLWDERSHHASKAEISVAIGCTTARSWMQSNSSAWTR